MKSIIEFILERKARAKNKKDEVKEGISVLDSILDHSTSQTEDERQKEINEFVKEFVKPNGPTIYAFVTDKVKDAVKVGYTDQHPEKRIAQWKEIYGKDAGEVTCIGYWSSEEFTDAGERVFFWDHAIHKKISDKGYKKLSKDEFMSLLTDKGKEIVDIHYSSEFFEKYRGLIQGKLNPNDKEELSAQLLEDLIKQMKANIKAGTADFKLYSFDKEGKTSSKEADKIWKSPDTYSNTKLQEEAIENGCKAIKEGKKNILMAAVMRFGKTHAAYEIVKQAGLKRVIVCSAKADVRTAWREDINHVHFYKDFVFIEVLDQYKWDVTYYKNDKLVTEHLNVYDNMLDPFKDKTIIFFFTLHDLGGSIKQIKEKHKKIFDEEFDLMIVDETHYGSHANTFGKVTKLNRDIVDSDEDDSKDLEEEQALAKESEEAINKLNVKYKSILQVSGTPYYILASNEMIDKDAAIISKVSYSDMLKARDEWDKEHKDEDPSKSPYFGIPTLHKIGLRLTKECRKAMKKNGVSSSLSELFKTKGGKFIYEDAVKSLMQSVFGNGKSDSLAFLSNKSVEGNKICKHTLIVLPRIRACKALKILLSTFIDTDERKIFNIVGNNPDVSSVDDLNNKLYELDNSGKKSIILTVNRYLTGVSMPCVDSMIYLKNASSPQEYDQNIFRLCTRYVKTVKDPDNESRSKKVNMKENVYLIDFNIANMFNMIANSARMKAAADGDPRIENIKKYMEEDLSVTPIFSEGGTSKEIMAKMKKIDSKDLMQIYTGYNSSKSIADIVNDDIDLFDNLFNNKKFQEIMYGYDIIGDNSKNTGPDNSDDGEEDLENMPTGSASSNKEIKKHIKQYLKDHSENNLIKITKEKFKAITKNLLYCNICLDDPCTNVEDIFKKAKEDKEFNDNLKSFNIDTKVVEDIYNNYMSTAFKQAYNSLFTRMAMLAQDASKDGYDKFITAIQGLGRIAKNEVVTPSEIVNKMINKLDESEYKKANTILLVNEKQGEFFMGIYNKFGKEVAKKCRIVSSSEIGKALTKKLLKSIGLNDYINTIILNIEDVDGNGKYDVNDFLKMDNDKILEMANGNNIEENFNTYYDKLDEGNTNRKIDIVLMNPPYSGSLHLDFLDKVIDVCNKCVVIEPGQWILQLKQNAKYTKENSKSVYIQTKINNHVKSIELNNFNNELNIKNKTACSITTIDFTKNYNEIDFTCVNETQKVKTLKDCNLIGNYKLVSSILNKCKTYKEHMIDHVIKLNKYKEYENKQYWFMKYGNYMIDSLSNIQLPYKGKQCFTNKFGTYYLPYSIVTVSNQISYNDVPKGVKRGTPADSIYFVNKNELENWKYYNLNNKLPIFINICLTIDEHNNSREYVPWLVDKQYTDEEIYKLLDINKNEQQIIDNTIKRFNIDSKWFKTYAKQS